MASSWALLNRPSGAAGDVLALLAGSADAVGVGVPVAVTDAVGDAVGDGRPAGEADGGRFHRPGRAGHRWGGISVQRRPPGDG